MNPESEHKEAIRKECAYNFVMMHSLMLQREPCIPESSKQMQILRRAEKVEGEKKSNLETLLEWDVELWEKYHDAAMEAARVVIGQHAHEVADHYNQMIKSGATPSGGLPMLRATEADLLHKKRELQTFDLGEPCEPSFDQVDIDDLYTQLEKQYKKYVHLGMEVIELECTAKVLRQYFTRPKAVLGSI